MNNITLPKFFKRKRVIVSVLLLGILLLSGYYFRYSIRTSLIPDLVSMSYRHSIEQQFDKEVVPVNSNIKQFGLTLDSPHYDYFSCDNNAADIDYSGLSGLKMTINCQKAVGSHDFKMDQQFLSQWRLHAKGLESYLKEHGWQQSENSLKTSIETFFEAAPTNNEYITYEKPLGDITCAVSIWRSVPSDEYGKSTAPDNNQVAGLLEGCDRDASFFGSYHSPYPNRHY